MWPDGSLGIVVQSIAEEIPETVALCKRISELIITPLHRGDAIRTLMIETSRRTRPLRLLQLVAPTEEQSSPAARPDKATVEELEDTPQDPEEGVDKATERLLRLATTSEDMEQGDSEVNREEGEGTAKETATHTSEGAGTVAMATPLAEQGTENRGGKCWSLEPIEYSTISRF